MALRHPATHDHGGPPMKRDLLTAVALFWLGYLLFILILLF